MNTPTKTHGQVKRLVLDIAGTKLVLAPTITKEEALSLIDTLAKGATRQETLFAMVGGYHREFDYAEEEVEIALRVTGAEIYPDEAAARQAADSADAAAKEVTK